MQTTLCENGTPSYNKIQFSGIPKEFIDSRIQNFKKFTSSITWLMMMSIYMWYASSDIYKGKLEQMLNPYLWKQIQIQFNDWSTYAWKLAFFRESEYFWWEGQLHLGWCTYKSISLNDLERGVLIKEEGGINSQVDSPKILNLSDNVCDTIKIALNSK